MLLIEIKTFRLIISDYVGQDAFLLEAFARAYSIEINIDKKS
ncbi:hypothetical protein [Anabaena sp. PCC 7108]|nr:hypothetical protein [Anabaena sp. PCC 7108]